MSVREDVIKTLIEQGTPERALDLLASFTAEGIVSPELTLLHGIALRETGMPEASERALLSAKGELGRDPRPYSELCVLYADLQRVDDALAACERSVHLDDEDARSWNNYGWLLLASSRPLEAIEAFNSAIDLDSSNERSRNNLGFAQVAAGRLDEAERTFRSSGSHADAAYNVGVALDQSGQSEPASAWFRTALSYDPSHEPARDALALSNDAIPAAPIPARGEAEESP